MANERMNGTLGVPGEHWNAAQIREDHAAGIVSKFAPPAPTVEGVPMESMTIPSGFIVRDSGARESFDSGMVRDTEDGKPDYTLLPREFLKRFAMHLTLGAKKYGRENWRKASSEAEMERFKRSASRHFQQWLDSFEDKEDLYARGYSTQDIDTIFAEDHMSAVAFNLAAAEFVKGRLDA